MCASLVLFNCIESLFVSSVLLPWMTEKATRTMKKKAKLSKCASVYGVCVSTGEQARKPTYSRVHVMYSMVEKSKVEIED